MSIVWGFDRTIYAKATETKWTEKKKKLKLCLDDGFFHMLMTCMNILSKCFADEGFNDALIQSIAIA